jgi:hypothetical protein
VGVSTITTDSCDTPSSEVMPRDAEEELGATENSVVCLAGIVEGVKWKRSKGRSCVPIRPGGSEMGVMKRRRRGNGRQPVI